MKFEGINLAMSGVYCSNADSNKNGQFFIQTTRLQLGLLIIYLVNDESYKEFVEIIILWKSVTRNIQSNLILTNSLGPVKFVCYNRGLL